MDRAKFLKSGRAGAVKLAPYTPPGWDEPIYLKPMSMADIKAELIKPDEPKEVRERIVKDQYYIERSLARIMRDADGALLFDDKDDAQMAELKAIVDSSPHDFSQRIHEARDGLLKPKKDEVDTAGN